MMMKKYIYMVFAGLLISGNASAVPVVLDIIDGDPCIAADVTATGYGSADNCIGLLDNAGSGNFNDSESLFNNELRYGNNDGDVIWDTSGAFGHNDWVFMGKDEQTEQTFINVTSGDPASWTVDSLLSGTYLIAAKQGNELGFWYFDALDGVITGSIDINSIFGSGIDDGGWSHVSIYGTASSVSEPTVIALLGVGLIGLGLARRKTHKHK